MVEIIAGSESVVEQLKEINKLWSYTHEVKNELIELLNHNPEMKGFSLEDLQYMKDNIRNLQEKTEQTNRDFQNILYKIEGNINKQGGIVDSAEEDWIRFMNIGNTKKNEPVKEVKNEAEEKNISTGLELGKKAQELGNKIKNKLFGFLGGKKKSEEPKTADTQLKQEEEVDTIDAPYDRFKEIVSRKKQEAEKAKQENLHKEPAEKVDFEKKTLSSRLSAMKYATGGLIVGTLATLGVSNMTDKIKASHVGKPEDAKTNVEVKHAAPIVQETEKSSDKIEVAPYGYSASQGESGDDIIKRYGSPKLQSSLWQNMHEVKSADVTEAELNNKKNDFMENQAWNMREKDGSFTLLQQAPHVNLDETSRGYKNAMQFLVRHNICKESDGHEIIGNLKKVKQGVVDPTTLDSEMQRKMAEYVHMFLISVPEKQSSDASENVLGHTSVSSNIPHFSEGDVLEIHNEGGEDLIGTVIGTKGNRIRIVHERGSHVEWINVANLIARGGSIKSRELVV